MVSIPDSRDSVTAETMKTVLCFIEINVELCWYLIYVYNIYIIHIYIYDM